MAKPVGLTVLKLRALEIRAKPYEARDPAVMGGYVVVLPSGARQLGYDPNHSAAAFPAAASERPDGE